MKLIVECEFGKSAEPTLALTFLLATGVDVSAVVVHPGDPDQVALVKLLLHHTSSQVEVIAAGDRPHQKRSLSHFHRCLLQDYDWPVVMNADVTAGEYLDKKLSAAAPFNVLSLGISSFFEQASSGQYHLTKATLALPTNRQPHVTRIGESQIAMLTEYTLQSLQMDQSLLEVLQATKLKDTTAAIFFRNLLDRWQGKRNKKPLGDLLAVVMHLHPHLGSWVTGHPKTIGMGSSSFWRTSDDGLSILTGYDRNRLLQTLSSLV